jgi:hypothetical protein
MQQRRQYYSRRWSAYAVVAARCRGACRRSSELSAGMHSPDSACQIQGIRVSVRTTRWCRPGARTCVTSRQHALVNAAGAAGEQDRCDRRPSDNDDVLSDGRSLSCSASPPGWRRRCTKELACRDPPTRLVLCVGSLVPSSRRCRDRKLIHRFPSGRTWTRARTLGPGDQGRGRALRAAPSAARWGSALPWPARP